MENKKEKDFTATPPKGPGAPRGIRMKGRGPKDTKKTLKRLMRYLSKYKLRIFFVLLLILMSAVASAASSLFLGVLIDDYIVPLTHVTNPVFTGLLKMLAFMACIYLAGALASLFYMRIMVVVAQGILKKIRDDMFEHMQKLPIRYFDSNHYGDIMSRYTNDTDTLRQMIAQTIPQFFSSAATITVVLVSMIYLSIPLTILVLLCVALMLKVTGVLGSKAGGYFVKQQKSLGKINGYIEEMISGQKVVKVFCHEDIVKEDFDKLNQELCDNATSANKIANSIMPIMANLGNLQYVIVAIFGGLFAVTGAVGGLTLGAIASFLQLTRNFAMPVNQIAQQVNNIAMALAGAERIFNLLDEEVESDEGSVILVDAQYNKDGQLESADHRTELWAWKETLPDGTAKYTELKGDVRFKDVDFGYEEGKEILHKINLYAEPGQKVAFVGATGAGKTTITNLINRFYDISDGEILYDGIPLKKIKKYDLRRSLGIILQDTNLFTGTVMDNIRYGRLTATDEDVIEAAKLANAHDFIMRLPEGYQTVLEGDGASLSQGQRQLLAIARAAVNDPPVMIMDEATSSIDTRTETIVQQGMDRLMQGRTVFVIAHRLSTVQNSDVIMVLDGGRIIERGSHDRLIEEKGRYYKLYTGAVEMDEVMQAEED